jgi:hypothetical protein
MPKDDKTEKKVAVHEWSVVFYSIRTDNSKPSSVFPNNEFKIK